MGGCLHARRDSEPTEKGFAEYAAPSMEVLMEGISISTTDFGDGSDVEDWGLLSLDPLEEERLGN